MIFVIIDSQNNDVLVVNYSPNDLPKEVIEKGI